MKQRMKWFLSLCAFLSWAFPALAQTPTHTPTTAPTATATPLRTPLTVIDVPFLSSRVLQFATTAGTNMKFANPSGDLLIFVKVGSGGGATVVTASSVPDPSLGRTGDVTLTLAANQTGVIGPLRPAGFNQRIPPPTVPAPTPTIRSDVGWVYLTFSATTQVTVEAVRFKE